MKSILFVESELNFIKIGFPFNELSEEYNLVFDGASKSKKNENYFKQFCLVVSCLYHSALSNFIVMKAKKKGIPTLLVSDGIFEWANAFNNPFTRKLNVDLYHPVFHDYFFCIGNEEKYYFQSQGSHTEMYLPERILNIKEKRVDFPVKQIVLITTANTAYFSENERIRLITLIKETTRILETINVEYIYRVFDTSIINELNIEKNKNHIEGSFKNVLKNVSSVITTPSSIILESMYHKRSVGQLIYRDTPLFLQSGWNLSLSCDLKDSLESLIKLDSDRMEFQNSQIVKYIPSKKIQESIDEMVSKKLKESKFVENNLFNLVNSKFNFNIEHSVRKIYNILNSTKFKVFLRKLRSKVGYSKIK